MVSFIKEMNTNRMVPGLLGTLCALVLTLAACAPIPSESPIPITETGNESISSPQPDEVGDPPPTPTIGERTEFPIMKTPERIPTGNGSTQPAITGETPNALLEAIKADLASRSEIASNDIIVIRDQFIVWPDGSLGCPQPGVVYTQAPVNGYWVVLKVGGDEYDYRATENGYFFLCQPGLFSPTDPLEGDPGQGLPPDQ
jgi:hypothetical protein